MIPAVIITIVFMEHRKSAPKLRLSALAGALAHGTKDVLQVFKYSKFYMLLFATAMSVGIGKTIHFNMDKSLEDTFWLSSLGGRFIGGVISYILFEYINGYLFGILYSAAGLVGCILLYVCSTGGADPTTAIILIGLSSGGYWSISPQIILGDAGTYNFGILWGLVLMVIFSSHLITDYIFSLFSKGSTKGLGSVCAPLPSVLFSLIAFVGFIAITYGYKKDSETATNKSLLYKIYRSDEQTTDRSDKIIRKFKV